MDLRDYTAADAARAALRTACAQYWRADGWLDRHRCASCWETFGHCHAYRSLLGKREAAYTRLEQARVSYAATLVALGLPRALAEDVSYRPRF